MNFCGWSGSGGTFNLDLLLSSISENFFPALLYLHVSLVKIPKEFYARTQIFQSILSFSNRSLKFCGLIGTSVKPTELANQKYGCSWLQLHLGAEPHQGPKARGWEEDVLLVRLPQDGKIILPLMSAKVRWGRLDEKGWSSSKFAICKIRTTKGFEVHN